MSGAWQSPGARALLWLVLVCAAACSPSDPRDEFGTPVAWVDGEPIPIQGLPGRFGAATPRRRRQLVDEAISDYLAAREARRRGLGQTENVVGKIVAIRREAEARERRVLRQALRDVETWNTEVGEDAVREYFERRKNLYSPRVVTLRVASFATEKAARRAESVLEASGQPPAGARDVGPQPQRALPAALRRAAAALSEPGAHVVAADVPDAGSWSVVELLGEARDEPVDFEQVREAIEQRVRSRLEQERFDAELERLRAAAEIRVDEGVLERDELWTRPAP